MRRATPLRCTYNWCAVVDHPEVLVLDTNDSRRAVPLAARLLGSLFSFIHYHVAALVILRDWCRLP